MVETRLNYGEIDPAAMKAMIGLEVYAAKSGLERSLYELIKIRASQINGCAYCLDMHTKDAKSIGETDQRMHCLAAWRETNFYSDRERAALEWTEAVTLISQNHVPDELYNSVKKHFTEQEMVAITMAVIAINGWNRLGISFRSEAGTYQPGSHSNS